MATMASTLGTRAVRRMLLVNQRFQYFSSMKPRPKTEAVIFDMGGVVIPSAIGELISNVSRANEIPPVDFMKVITDPNGHWAKLERGELILQDFINQLTEDVSLKTHKVINLDVLFRMLSDHETFSRIPTSPEIIDSIQCLKADGVKVALLTNNYRINETTTLMPLDPSLFDVIIESCKVGLRKPEPEIYKLCLSKLDVSPSSAVFLDDFGINVKAAKELGIRTIKVGDIKKAIEELEQEVGFSVQGYVPGTITVPERLRVSHDKLATYINDHLGISGDGLPLVRCYKHGQSNPTYSVKYGNRTMVLRKKPPGKLLPSAHAIEREYRVMGAVQKSGVPAPPLLDLCEDDNVLGTPFYMMDHVPGSVYTDYFLPGMTNDNRARIYSEMCDVLCRIHCVDIDTAQLSDYGKPGEYIKRNFTRWQKQYESSKTDEIDQMEKLGEWIPQHCPSTQQTTVVHGDFRLDNLIYDETFSVKAVLDWELSTLGDPLSDLATCCLPYYLPENFPIIAGFGDCDVTCLGIPSVEEFVSEYCRRRGLVSVDNWNVYMVFVLYRMAAICQGVYRRALDGQSSSPTAMGAGAIVKLLSQIAWNLTRTGGVAGSPTSVPQTRSYSTHCHSRGVTQPQTQTYMGGQSPAYSTEASQISPMPITLSSLSARVQELHSQVTVFIEDHILPLERELREREHTDEVWVPHPSIDVLKAKARSMGLWNLFLPLESDPEQRYGAGLTNLEYAFLSEQMGKCLPSSEIFNCSPPDTGNMEVLVKYGTEEQKEEWLAPLLDGSIRSCFAMTEPKVASSDATNIEASITRDGQDYIISGHKWWTSGALHPSCKIAILMGKSLITGPIHKQQSMILVPMDAPGVRVVRPLSVFGMTDPPAGHGEVEFNNVRVPASNLILGEGRGFEIAQGRLGPGRIHHCMRLIGAAERALQLMVNRVQERVAFGKPLADQGTIQADIAESRIEIEQTRLLVLKAAHYMDTVGNTAAAPQIAMIKVATPLMAQRVIDRAIQAHGGAGLHSDLPLANMFAAARTLRLADGPDEVHRRTIAKMEYRSIKDRKKL